MTDLSRSAALQLLHSIPPNLPREDWLKAGMAAKAAGLSEDDLVEWSRHAENFTSDKDVVATFRSVGRDGGITPATLVWMARQFGSSVGMHAGLSSMAAGIQPDHRRDRPVDPVRPGDVWDSCHEATASHDYILRKRGVPDGLRVVTATSEVTNIAGKSVVGWLAVPVRPIGQDHVTSIQFIPPIPGMCKLNLPGAKLDGVHIVGNTASDDRLYVCEGIGQAWAYWQATGAPAVVSFGWGRTGTVIKQLRLAYPTASLVLVPDKGKENEARKLAAEVGASVAELPTDEVDNFDANDFALRDGTDELERILEEAEFVPRRTSRFNLLSGATVSTLPRMEWRVRNVLPAKGLAAVYGPSGAGKSFLVLDMAATIAEGGDWFGHRTTPAPVVYVALEGSAGMVNRTSAWAVANGRGLPQQLSMVLDPFALNNATDVRDLADEVARLGRGAVVIIDTLNASAPGMDENASKDMGVLIGNAKLLAERTGGLVVLVHHSGKETSKGLRGHSSLHAALDTAIEVRRTNGAQSWVLMKNKDGRDGVGGAFSLRP